jgi:hypothetical protein
VTRAGLATAAALATLALAAPALGAYRPQLVVSPARAGLGQASPVVLAFSQPSDDDATAKVAITVPADYGVTLGHAPGTALGTARAQVTVRGFDVGPITVQGRIGVAEPARHGAAALACGVAAVTAVWSIELHAPTGQSFTFPIFVERPGAGAALRVCFPSPDVPEAQGGAPFGVKLVSAELTLPRVFTNPSARSRSLWSGLFTPYVRGTAVPGATVEARAVVPVPASLTLARRFVGRGRRTVVLSGRLTEAGERPAGVAVELYAARASGGQAPRRVARTRTLRGGRFSFRRPTTRTQVYAAVVQPRDSTPRDCAGPTAPGGCSALVAPRASRRLTVAAPRRRR